jgi:hypothetical protein
MVPQFDIFRVLSAKEHLWIEAAVTLDDAITRVRQIGAVQSGKYFIHSQKTHVEIAITVRRSANVRPNFSTEPLTVRRRPRLPCKPRTVHEEERLVALEAQKDLAFSTDLPKNASRGAVASLVPEKPVHHPDRISSGIGTGATHAAKSMFWVLLWK